MQPLRELGEKSVEVLHAMIENEPGDTTIILRPELVPGGAEKQKTEGVLGRYELHDFFLYHFLKFGETPENLAALARAAFGKGATKKEIAAALAVFLRRFVTQQFKRDASPDGPKVGTIGLSPRGDWRAPADASTAVFSH